MTEGEKEFLKLIISKCHGKHVSSKGGNFDIKFGIKDMEIENAMVASGEYSKVIKRLTHDNNSTNYAILVN